MSWNINIVGKPADVKAAINKQDQLPQSLKDAVAAIADAGAGDASAPGAVHVKTSGHMGGAWSSISDFSVVKVALAPPAPEAPAAT